MRKRLIDIAKQLNVSHTTVSRALNPDKRHLISEQVRNRILDLAEEMNVIPNRAGRAFISGPKTIGIILPTVMNSVFFSDYLSKIITGVFDTIKDNLTYKCNMVFLPKQDNLSELDLRSLTNDLSGLFVSCYCSHFTWNAGYMPAKLSAVWKKPVVYINPEIKRVKNHSYVTFSNFQAVKKAILHVLRKGHRKIGFVYGDKDFEESLARYQGFVQTMKEHHLKVTESLMKKGNYNGEDGYKAAVSLCEKKSTRPTAIFCANDEMAIGAMRALTKMGIACPQEVSVMGFDGLAVGDYVTPKLSTVTQPFTEMASAGMQLLIDLIEEKVNSPQVRTLDSQLIVRDSVTSPRT